MNSRHNAIYDKFTTTQFTIYNRTYEAAYDTICEYKGGMYGNNFIDQRDNSSMQLSNLVVYKCFKE